MYSVSSFDEERLPVLHGLIEAYPLGALVSSAGGLSADHIPFEIALDSPDAPFGLLRAHVGRANPLWRRDGEEVMALFQGPSAYVSPSLYEEKAVSGKVVPTWNYAVVHAHGTLRAIDDATWMLALLDRLSRQHEGKRAFPWAIQDAPAGFIDQLLGVLVGIEIPITRIQGKWKMSQNRSATDQATVKAQVPAIAAMMG